MDAAHHATTTAPPAAPASPDPASPDPTVDREGERGLNARTARAGSGQARSGTSPPPAVAGASLGARTASPTRREAPPSFDRVFHAFANRLGWTDEVGKEPRVSLSSHDDQVSLMRAMLSTANRFPGDARRMQPALVHALRKELDAAELRVHWRMIPSGEGERPGVLVREALVAAAAENRTDEIVALLEGNGVPTVRDERGSQRWDADLSAALLSATKNGSLHTLRRLVSAGADVNRADERQLTPLMHAAIVGADAIASVLLGAGADPNREDEKGETALMHAASAGSTRTVRTLMEYDVVDVDRRTTQGEHVLHKAASQHDEEIVEILLRRAGHLIGVPDGSGSSPLVHAALATAPERSCAAVARRLPEAGADANDNPTDLNPLHLVAQRNDVGFAEALLDNGADPNPRDNRRATPMIVAARSGSRQVLEMLADRGGDPRLADRDGMTPLLHAVSRGFDPLVKRLASLAPETLELPDRIGNTALMSAMGRHVRTTTVLHLLTRGEGTHGRAPMTNVPRGPEAYINWRGSGGRAALHHALQLGNDSAARLLLQHGADPDVADDNGVTPLMQAADDGRLDVSMRLLGRGADAGRIDRPWRHTALSYAARGGHEALAMALTKLDPNIDVDRRDSGGRTALMHMADKGRIHAVRALLERGANTGLHEWYGDSALSLAASSGHRDVVTALFENGSDVDPFDTRGDTPLIRAIEGGRHELVSILLARGADVRHRNIDGHTALAIAAMMGQGPTVGMLLERGAAIDPVDRSGHPLLERVSSRGHDDVVRLLQARAEPPAVRGSRRENADALLAAAGRDDVEGVRTQLGRGTDPNRTDRLGRNALMLAIDSGSTRVVDLLLPDRVEDIRTDLNARDLDGVTALRRATQRCLDAPDAPDGSASLARLLAVRADPNVPDLHGRTPLMIAAEARNGAPVVRELLRHEALPNATDHRVSNALTYAVRKDNVETATALLSVVDRYPDMLGQEEFLDHSPLAIAVLRGNLGIMSMLIRAVARERHRHGA